MQTKQLSKIYVKQFPNSLPTIVASAPGRVNLLGEHTDYNDGFVLPLAIDAQITFVGAPNNTNKVNLYSADFKALDSFALEDIKLVQKNTWSNYIRGVCAMLIAAGHPLAGMNIVLQGNVPLGAGLSSSAALEVAAALFIQELNQLKIDRVELVKIAQKAENDFVGVNCGIMDQFISMMGEKDHALFLDCRTLEYQLVEAPFAKAGYSLVVINSGVKRGLVDSEYNLRRSQCEEAVKALRKDLPQITALRDVTIQDFDLIKALPSELRKRAMHVVTENQRVIDGVKALRENDLKTFGRLLNESHESLRSDYEVSCFELDLLVQLTRSISGTIGARMTGAGFGGSMIALTAQDQVEDLKEKINKEYQKQTGITPEIFIFNAAQGARIIEYI